MTSLALPKPLVVAIDGPAGAGKSQAAVGLARVLGVPRFDTGSLYRVYGKACLMMGVDINDDEACGAVAGSISIGMEAGAAVSLNGVDIRDVLRGGVVADAASRVSALPSVREALLEFQREQARLLGCVAEGRDVTTVVFPDANFKFYLDARPEVRAERIAKSQERYDLAAVAAELLVRDVRDKSRDIAPLIIASDAIVVDNSDIDEVETLRVLVGFVHGKT